MCAYPKIDPSLRHMFFLPAVLSPSPYLCHLTSSGTDPAGEGQRTASGLMAALQRVEALKRKPLSALYSRSPGIFVKFLPKITGHHLEFLFNSFFLRHLLPRRLSHSVPADPSVSWNGQQHGGNGSCFVAVLLKYSNSPLRPDCKTTIVWPSALQPEGKDVEKKNFLSSKRRFDNKTSVYLEWHPKLHFQVYFNLSIKLQFNVNIVHILTSLTVNFQHNQMTISYTNAW